MVKKLVALIIFILGCYYIYDNNLFNAKYLIKDWRREVEVPNKITYQKLTDVSFVKETDDFVPNDYQDLLNIYYTILNNGWNEFTFYCPSNYKSCIEDVKTISADKTETLSHLNSFVEPYNIYNNIYTTYYETGKVTLTIKRLYSKAMIDTINARVDELYNQLVAINKSPRENILAIHDYLINHTTYDTKKIDNINDNTYQSNTAYGVLFQGYAVCSGYADAMAIFLDKMNIPNIKVATDSHVWNLVYIDNKWEHLDLTWDDPVTEKAPILSHKFFLITGAQIEGFNTGEHSFDVKVYSEAQ